MHLIHPFFLNADACLPDMAIRPYAQVLLAEYGQQLGVFAPRVTRGKASVESNRKNETDCQAPTGHLAHCTGGDLVLAALPFTALSLQFTLAHHMAHLVCPASEWEYDLVALDLINCPEPPFVQRTALVIAQVHHLRRRALQFRCGDRVVAVGDALQNHTWDDCCQLPCP